MSDIFEDFPFEEFRRYDGDYFTSLADAKDHGFNEHQIWSVTESDGSFSYGPPHHWINIIGFVATAETHDGDTYYHEELDNEEDD